MLAFGLKKQPPRMTDIEEEETKLDKLHSQVMRRLLSVPMLLILVSMAVILGIWQLGMLEGKSLTVIIITVIGAFAGSSAGLVAFDDACPVDGCIAGTIVGTFGGFLFGAIFGGAVMGDNAISIISDGTVICTSVVAGIGVVFIAIATTGCSGDDCLQKTAVLKSEIQKNFAAVEQQGHFLTVSEADIMEEGVKDAEGIQQQEDQLRQ